MEKERETNYRGTAATFEPSHISPHIPLYFLLILLLLTCFQHTRQIVCNNAETDDTNHTTSAPTVHYPWVVSCCHGQGSCAAITPSRKKNWYIQRRPRSLLHYSNSAVICFLLGPRSKEGQSQPRRADYGSLEPRFITVCVLSSQDLYLGTRGICLL